ncbi:carbohydrate ABC transporter permease [Salipaludibacillus aurantiacus]|uniref:Multiple sugar transport system permease protein/raffinose/stachyose/melibiose transport system permease protein n=1 Tax=Salipaludibacillus aurantiacus TaxID=1601833 RepID=A0A1H9SEZ0_9BACI|nr:sugar ABC transporter permease [Salipaludibacillus aurantiacus]SER83541.1 multiple sugar transport system permease protein/raffinose/stachyose/melibiose transport system permease protein [Salipaludibacillus aurantiacus]
MNQLIQKLKNNDWTGTAFLLPAAIILSLFVVYPIIWAFLVSFRDIRPMEMRGIGLFTMPGEFVWLQQYIDVFNNSLFIKSLFNTAYFGIIYIPITLISAALLAVLLNQKMNGVNFFRTVLFIPYIISVVSASLIFMFLFNGDRGMINAVLMQFNISGPNWLADSLLAMPVIAIMSAWKKIGYFMLIYLAGLQNIPNSLYEAAKIDGANAFQRFWFVTWPMLGRITLVVSVLLMIDTLNVFQEVFVMTGGGPADSTTTVPFLIYNEGFQYFRIGSASAMSYILFVVVIVITLLQKRSVDKKLG